MDGDEAPLRRNIMLYVVGTDEAGYGPHLGPLVIAATVWEIDEPAKAHGLYRALRKVICNDAAKATAHKIAMADSKALYSPDRGLHDLDEAALVDILSKPKNALIKQYQRLFEMEDVKLTFADEAVAAVARKAIARKTGARGLRSILEAILLDPMFDLPNMNGVEEVVISPDVVEGRAKPLLIYADRKQEDVSA